MLCRNRVNRPCFGLRRADTIGVVGVAQGGACGVGAGGGCGELAAILPGKGPAAVAQGVAAAIVGDGAVVHRRQQVLPVAGAVGIALDNARAVRDRENIARSVVGVGLSGAVTLGHGQEIPGGVVGADGGTLDARAAAGYIPSKCTRQIALSTH